MIEDALTTTRALQRLLLAASAVALVFVSSLADVRTERRLLKDLRRFRSLPVADYKEFVNEKIAASIVPSLEASANQFQEELERQLTAASLQVLGSGQIAAVFRLPLHVGRLDPEQSILVQPNATLDQLDRASAMLPIDRDIQIVTADPAGLILKIVSFVAGNTTPGLLGTTTVRIENVQVEASEAPYAGADSFLPAGLPTPRLRLTFELHRDSGGGAPIFEEDFSGTVQTLPDSSFNEWLTQNAANAGELFMEVSGRFRWLGDQASSPTQRNKPLNALEQELSEHIDSATAKNRTIDLPGISVPGSLALFAIPVLLLALASSFLHHLEHLQRFVPDHRETFAQFAWTPLMAGYSWRWEMAATVALLPALVQFLLAWRYDAFELPAPLVITTGVVGALGSLLLGWKAVRHLEDLRQAVEAKLERVEWIYSRVDNG